ncbi:MAG TPA: DUF503 domain-containing protein [Acidimicrobiales bacterium]|nr:DUF503 domain-containing protein [Acidimicrobiales bacterium]
MHAAAMEVDLHIPESRSLKAKRAAVKPIVEGLRRRFNVAVSEVDHQDQWQRCLIGVAAVASSHAHLTDILDEAERFVWSRPDIQVLSIERRWLDAAE